MDPDGALPRPSAAPPPRPAPRPRFGLGGGAGRSLALAAVSTVVVFGLLAIVIVNSTGWPRFQQAFLNGPIFWE